MALTDQAIIEFLIKTDSGVKNLKDLETAANTAIDNLVQLSARVDFDPASEEVRRLRDEVVRTSTEFAAASKRLQAESKAIATVLKESGRESGEVFLNLTDDVDHFTSEINNLEAEITQLEGAHLDSLREDFLKAEAAAKDLIPDIDRIEKEFDQVEQKSKFAMSVARLEMLRAKNQAKETGSAVGTIGTGFQRTPQALDAVTGSLGKLTNAIRLVAASFVAIQIKRLIKDSIDLASTMDVARRRFVGLKGSQEEANVELEFAAKLARDLKVRISDVTDGYSKFAFTLEGTTLEGEKGRRVFTAIANAMRASGANAEQFAGGLKAVTDIISKGKVQAEELRGQLGDRIPGAFLIAAEAIRKEGETIEQAGQRLDEMVKKGEVLAGEFLPKFAEVLEKKFANQLKSVLDGPVASLEELGVKVDLVKQKFGEGFLNEIAGSAREASDSLDKLGEGAETAGSVFGVFGAAFLNVFDQLIDNYDEATVKSANFLEILLRTGKVDLSTLAADAGKIPEAVDVAKESVSNFTRSVADGSATLKDANESISLLQAAYNDLNSAGVGTEEIQRLLSFMTKELIKDYEKLGVDIKSLPKPLQDLLLAIVPLVEEEKKLSETQKVLGEEITKGAQRILESVGAYAELEQKSKDTVQAFFALVNSGSLTTEVHEELKLMVVQLREAYEKLGKEAPESLNQIATEAETAQKKVDEFLKSLIGDQKKLEKQTEVLIGVGNALAELSREGKLTKDVAEKFSEEVADLNKEWVKFGKDAPKALQLLAKAFPPVESNVDELLTKSQKVVSELEKLRDRARALRQEAERRVTGGQTSEDLEQEQIRLKQRLEELRDVAILTHEEFAEMEQVQQSLIEVSRVLNDLSEDNILINNRMTEQYAENAIEAEKYNQEIFESRKAYEERNAAEAEASAGLGKFTDSQKAARVSTEDFNKAADDASKGVQFFNKNTEASTKIQFELQKQTDGTTKLVAVQRREYDKTAGSLAKVAQSTTDAKSATDQLGEASKRAAELQREQTESSIGAAESARDASDALEDQAESVDKVSDSFVEQQEQINRTSESLEQMVTGGLAIAEVLDLVNDKVIFLNTNLEIAVDRLGRINASL